MKYVLSIGFEILELSFSPIKGPEGNIEYLLYIRNTDQIPEENDLQENFRAVYDGLIRETVAAAHGMLDKDPEKQNDQTAETTVESTESI